MNNKKNTGLSNKEVMQSRLKYGSNVINRKKKNSFIKLVIESFSDPIIKILLLALAIKIIFLFNDSNIYETLGIVVAIFLATFVSALSEYGSEKAFEKLCDENSILSVKVMRNSKKIVINSEELVCGDIVYLESGDKVPADGKIISGEVYVDESALTGESYEKCKNINDCDVYMGSIVNEKKAIMEVTHVGEKTFYGKIANDIQERTIESPLKSRLRDLAKDISKFGYIAALFVFLSYMFNAIVVANDFDINKMLAFKSFIPHLIYAVTLSVAVIVMAVPEGLPMMITLVLSSNMKRMINKNVLVRKLVGIETSGSLNILFTDKTGTLTEGKLSVTSIVTPEFYNYNNIDKINKNPLIKDIMHLSLVYNNSSFYNEGNVEGGNSTDRAILSFCKTDSKEKYKIIKSKEFNSVDKYSSITTDYKNMTFFKGATELILEKSNKYITNNGEERVLINKNNLLKYIDNKMSEGNRVIALAMSKSEEFESLILIGFVLLKDNVRKESLSAIQTIKTAGIQTVMVTGDAKETAISVAKEVKIIDSDNDIVLTSDEFNKMTDEYLMSILPRLKVLSRALPQDKNRLVKISQAKGLIVGMTGDGVNDASALKKADVGFSMGSGTEVAKETSDIVILDDNIMSITTAILYGRTIFKSIRKFVIFQLTVNVSAVLLSVIGPFIGILSPVTVVQMLWINMVMDTLAGLAFAFEPTYKEYMNEKPKARNEKIINKYMKNQIIFNSIYTCVISIFFLKSKFISSIYRYDPNDKYLMTAFFGLFIFLAIFNAVNARTHRINTFANLLKNKVFIFIILFIAIVQIILIYFGGEIFRTTGLTIYEFEIMLFLAFTVIPFDFLRKIILKKKNIAREI